MTSERAEEIRIMSLPGMQKFIKEKMGEWQAFDNAHWIKDGVLYFRPKWKPTPGFLWFYTDMDMTIEIREEDPQLIRLPPPIDRDNTSRGLWGMVDWDHYRFVSLDNGEALTFYQTIELSDQAKWNSGRTTPTLALLKAIAHQIGEEV